MGWLQSIRVVKDAAKAGAQLLRKVDLSVALSILERVVTLEAELSQPGSGSLKREHLFAFVRETWPSAAAWLDEVEEFVRAAVALFNALKWFRK
jgi:hypothetical protein